MILHIPHSSVYLPKEYQNEWLGDPNEAIRVLTDHFTDELFEYEGVKRLIFPISRIVCDVERFEEGEQMEMDYGMGIVYERDHLGRPLRAFSSQMRSEIVERYYRPHHDSLTNSVNEMLNKQGTAIIVDCHSFNDEELLHVVRSERPDFCIGSDDFHTPSALVSEIQTLLESKGYDVAVNQPFAGTIVPLEHYQKNSLVMSVMIEVNKRLYLDAHMGKSENFESIRSTLAEILRVINNFKRKK